ncbi:MAG: signal recognition particle-docking protein FtsY [Chitinophagaceae bacterium]
MSILKNLFKNKPKSKTSSLLYTRIHKKENNFWTKITGLFSKENASLSEEILEEIEEILITADIGMETTSKILAQIEKKASSLQSEEDWKYLLQEELLSILKPVQEKKATINIIQDKPYIIMVVGINGSGKTTSIGKLSQQFREKKYQVMLGAADTFRAAAIEQLNIWADRTGASIVKRQQGEDPSAVAFDTIQSAIAKNKDIVLIDTAGRLHNKTQLMEELSKMKRVISKAKNNAPNEILLVIDGSTGQNALEQVKHFAQATPLSGIILTKMDGTAKGGIVFAIADQTKIPIQYIGIGERVNDLVDFDAEDFVKSIFA